MKDYPTDADPSSPTGLTLIPESWELFSMFPERFHNGRLQNTMRIFLIRTEDKTFQVYTLRA